MAVLIGDPGAPLSTYDTRTIVGFGSFVLNAPLSRHYPAKTIVRVFETGTDVPLPNPPLLHSERSNNPGIVVSISTSSAVQRASRPLGPPLISINRALFSPSIQARQIPQTPPPAINHNHNDTIYNDNHNTTTTTDSTPPPTLRGAFQSTAVSGAPSVRVLALALGLPPVVTLRQGINTPSHINTTYPLLLTHPLHQYTLSYQHNIPFTSIHLLTSTQHTLSTHPFNASSHPALSTHHTNSPSYPLSLVG